MFPLFPYNTIIDIEKKEIIIVESYKTFNILEGEHYGTKSTKNGSSQPWY